MRIVCISDTHGLHRELAIPAADVLIHAGDFLMAETSIEEVAAFNEWIGAQPCRHKIVVAGNHDKCFETDPAKARAVLTNAVYLQNSSVMLEGIRFWGSPVTPVIPNMAFAVERGTASKKFWDQIPEGTDVLITHGPPFGTLDKEDVLGSHMGCKQLTQALLRVRPRLHIFGHVHGGYGQEPGPNSTMLVNCALKEGAHLRPPILIDLESRQ